MFPWKRLRLLGCVAFMLGVMVAAGYGWLALGVPRDPYGYWRTGTLISSIQFPGRWEGVVARRPNPLSELYWEAYRGIYPDSGEEIWMQVRPNGPPRILRTPSY